MKFKTINKLTYKANMALILAVCLFFFSYVMKKKLNRNEYNQTNHTFKQHHDHSIGNKKLLS
jgi:hypothetical protein